MGWNEEVRLREKMKEKVKCEVWKEQSKIDFNFYYSELPKKKEISFDEISDLLLYKNGNKITNKKIVINGGHIIPNLKNQAKVGKNPLETWTLACRLTEKLRAMEFDANLSLIINDLPFTPEERKKIKLILPKPYEKIMEKYGLKYDHVQRIMHNSKSAGEEVYTEKKLANRAAKEKDMDKWNEYKKEIDNYCVQSLLTYFLDSQRQGAETIIFIVPKCSSGNLIKAINIFQRKEKKVRIICYFVTNNCFL